MSRDELLAPAALRLFLTPATRPRRRTRAGADVTGTVSPGEVIGSLRGHEITLTWNPAAVLAARVPELQARHRKGKLDSGSKALTRKD